MSVKENEVKITITNALTGKTIEIIKMELYEEEIILGMIANIIHNDMKYNKDGLLIKYGY